MTTNPVLDLLIQNAQTADGAAPRIDAFRSVLALDTAMPPTVGAAPIRHALMDVNDDGTFDAEDIQQLLSQYSADAPPWSRYDLNGDGMTGGPNKVPFDLDRIQSTQYGAPSYAPAVGQNSLTITFDETAVSDLNILCYYAYSALYEGAGDERNSLLADSCGVDAGAVGGGSSTAAATGVTFSGGEAKVLANYSALFSGSEALSEHERTDLPALSAGTTLSAQPAPLEREIPRWDGMQSAASQVTVTFDHTPAASGTDAAVFVAQASASGLAMSRKGVVSPLSNSVRTHASGEVLYGFEIDRAYELHVAGSATSSGNRALAQFGIAGLGVEARGETRSIDERRILTPGSYRFGGFINQNAETERYGGESSVSASWDVTVTLTPLGEMPNS